MIDMNVTTKIKKWGNSQGVMLSKKLLSSIGIDDPNNQEINIKVEDSKLILEKVDNSQSRLMQEYGYLIDGHRSGELDWGEDVGKERF